MNTHDPWAGMTLEQKRRIRWCRTRMPRRVPTTTPLGDAVGCAVFFALVWAGFCLVGALL